MVLMSTDALTSRGFYITLGSWIGDTAHLAARLQLENGGLKPNKVYPLKALHERNAVPQLTHEVPQRKNFESNACTLRVSRTSHTFVFHSERRRE